MAGEMAVWSQPDIWAKRSLAHGGRFSLCEPSALCQQQAGRPRHACLNGHAHLGQRDTRGGRNVAQFLWGPPVQASRGGG
eukprot:7167270-Alexandrium_andersonii.AAC.1